MKLVLLNLCLLLLGTLGAIPDPARFSTYLLKNRWESGLPLSYYVPEGYYASIPNNERPQFFDTPQMEPQCNNEMIPAALMNDYQFQTEEMLSTAGLNLYPKFLIFCIYQHSTLVNHKTLQFVNIKADRECRGVLEWGQCSDPHEDGACGFCYGDSTEKSLDIKHAYYFRMISDVWSFDGTEDARCPKLDGKTNTWKWNDYRPVTGENSWASLIGPLQAAYLKAGKKVNNIPDDSPALQLALDMIPAVERMLVEQNGAIYYAPRNTWDGTDPEIGDTVSTENNASLLAGLKMLLYILSNKSGTKHSPWIARVDNLVKHITNYIRSTYDSNYGYFRQGGKFDGETHQWTWVPEPYFAVDCQTWVLTVLGREVIDSWFGEGTCLNIWNNTKNIGGYKKNPVTSWVRGVGFTDNQKDQVFSGEWSLGAINMLYVLANSYSDQPTKTALIAEAEYMRQALETDLVTIGTLKNGFAATGVKYANKRYFIPFGWYANPLWSTASVAWTVTTDLLFNPFYLGGDLKSNY